MHVVFFRYFERCPLFLVRLADADKVDIVNAFGQSWHNRVLLQIDWEISGLAAVRGQGSGFHRRGALASGLALSTEFSVVAHHLPLGLSEYLSIVVFEVD